VNTLPWTDSQIQAANAALARKAKQVGDKEAGNPESPGKMRLRH